jgi:hypothetical protein
MDASLRPDTDSSIHVRDASTSASVTEDQLRNLSASQNAQRAIAALNRANEIASGVEDTDPLVGFDKENATRGEVEDKLHNLSAMMTVIRTAKPDLNTWNTAEWDIDLAMQEVKREIELRDTIIRDRKRRFRMDPILARAQHNEVMTWASGHFGFDKDRGQMALDRRETTDERRLREANPDLPVIKSIPHLFAVAGMPIYQREVRLFKTPDDEAQRKAHMAMGDALTKDEQELLMGVGHRMYEEEKRKEANREKVRKHREKHALTGEYVYREDYPDDWTEADILRYLSPPTTERDLEANPLTRKERDRDRKRAARAVAKKPIEGSNEAPEPQLAPLAYRQKMAAIKARISTATLPVPSGTSRTTSGTSSPVRYDC